MSNILFLQDVLFEFHGVTQLSAILKENGHNCDILIWPKEKNLIKKIKKIKPDIVTFSISSPSYKEAIQIALKIKDNLGIKNVFGGPHPTYFPEMIYKNGVDIICRGEGEESLLELVNNLRNNKDITKIKNLWVKDKSGKIHKNDVRPLFQNLDKLPFPDREIYYNRYKFLKNFPIKRFLTSRGCPWNCTFCYNRAIKKFYKGKGIHLRKRSVKNCIKEILLVKEKYSLRSIRFSDETFTYNKQWLKDFLPKLKKEVNLPFTCLARADELEEEIVKLLKESGCKSIFLGIETGNENLRNTVLNKNLSNASIINAARLLKKYKIKFGTYNMFGLPKETLENAFETIALNTKIKADYPYSSLFHPFPKTRIAIIAKEEGVLPKEFDIENINLMSEENRLNIKNKNEILNLSRFFYFSVKYPFLLPIIKQLIKLPTNKLYKWVSDFSVMISKGRAFNANFKDMLKVGLELRKDSPT